MGEREPRWIDYLPVDHLILVFNPLNPKGHNLDELRRAMERFGYTEPIMLDERTGLLVSGHGRVELLDGDQRAGRSAPDGIVVSEDGRWYAPVTRGWSSANDDEAAAYLIAANRLTEIGGWKSDPLADLLVQLSTTEHGLEGIGYTKNDLDVLLAQLEKERAQDTDADENDGLIPEHPVTTRGDLWLLGKHRILCGDARATADVATLLQGDRVNLAFTSPPYADRRTYDEASGFEPVHPDQYVDWFAPVAANVAANLAPDGSWFVNITANADGLDKDLYVMDLVVAHVRAWGWHYVDELCWPRVGVPYIPRYRFKRGWEPVHHFVRGDFKFRPKAVRYFSEHMDKRDYAHMIGSPADWQGSTKAQRRALAATRLDSIEANDGTGLAYPSNRLSSFAGSHEALGHRAAFPVGLPEWFCRAYTDEGDVVFDPFLGTASTVLAAHRTGRVGVGIELSPGYVDLSLRRVQSATGIVPVLARTGERFDFSERAGQTARQERS